MPFIAIFQRARSQYGALHAHSQLPLTLQVETIGDAYMVVGNLRKQHADHAARVGRFAIDAIQAANGTLVSELDPTLVGGWGGGGRVAQRGGPGGVVQDNASGSGAAYCHDAVDARQSKPQHWSERLQMSSDPIQALLCSTPLGI